MIVSAIFLISNPSLESLIAILAGIFAFLSSFLNLSDKNSHELLSTRYDKAREIYLAWLADDIRNRLEVSIHRALYLELNMIERPNTTIPWTYKSYLPQKQEEQFDNFHNAFVFFRNRILLLGQPGSGKTTTLLETAKRLVEKTENSLNAPIPILINLSKWFGREYFDDRLSLTAKLNAYLRSLIRRSSTQSIFEKWLIFVIGEFRGPKVPYDVRTFWVQNGQISLLLDGLDELPEQYRSRFIQSLNEYITTHPEISVIVTSRTTDYEAIQIHGNLRVAVEGAVELQILHQDQIYSYLTSAHAIALRDSLANDAELNELAQVPLMLSLMTLAYESSAPEVSLSRTTPQERRVKLFDFYIERMMQRKARRDSNDPELHTESLNPQEDQKTKYSARNAYKYWGWVALRLGERSKTTFNRADIYYVAREGRKLISENNIITTFIISVVVFLVALYIVMWQPRILADQSHYWISISTYIALSIGIYWGITLLEKNPPSINAKGISIRLFLNAIPSVFSGLIGLISYFILPISITLSLHYVLARSFGTKEDISLLLCLFILPIIASSLYSISFSINALIRNDNSLAKYIKQLQNRNSHLTHLSTKANKLAFLGYGLFDAMRFGIALGILYFSLGDIVTLVSFFVGYSLGPATVAIFLGTVNTVGDKLFGISYVFITLIVSTICVGLGMPWSIISSIVLTILVSTRWGTFIQEHFVQPIIEFPLRIVLALNGVWPFHDQEFLMYSSEALIMKTSGNEYEFMHRLLRDHFIQLRLVQQTSANPRWLATLYFEIRDYERALVQLNSALNIVPYDTKLRTLRAQTNFILHNFEDALVDLNEIVPTKLENVNAQHISSILNRAHAHFQLKHYAEALKDIDIVLSIAPNHREATVLRQEIETKRDEGNLETLV